MSARYKETTLQQLESLRYPSVVRDLIEKRLERIEFSRDKSKCKTPHFCFNRLQIYEDNINHLNEIRKNLNSNCADITMPIVIPETEKQIHDLASKASIYFSQGYEMYKSSIGMDINSSPIIEYYAFLQIIKAVILLELEVETDNFFGAHGLTRNKSYSTEDVYQASTKKHGVFASILIRFTDYLDNEDGTRIFKMDDYIRRSYSPTFRYFIKNLQLLSNIPEAFIFSWMLSEIARYHPVKWKEIYGGIENKWIISISKFQDKTLPEIIRSLISSHIS